MPEVSVKPTKILAEIAKISPSIALDGQPLEVVEDFCHLSSKISNDVLLTKDIKNRTAKAMGTLSRLHSMEQCLISPKNP